ncbi:MAG TPA: hypothetical protein EYP19_12150 [Desulfobacterales bacterium]|nr:hypothetical protein [Desulfobacterales bacterium]
MATIVLGKRYGGDERGWVYEPEICPACDNGYRDWYPCGVCQGTGKLFEDGYLNEDQLKALTLVYSGEYEKLMDFADMLTAAYVDHIDRTTFA